MVLDLQIEPTNFCYELKENFDVTIKLLSYDFKVTSSNSLQETQQIVMEISVTNRSLNEFSDRLVTKKIRRNFFNRYWN